MSATRFRNSSAAVQQPLVSTSNAILQQIGKLERFFRIIRVRNVVDMFFAYR